jgi:DNA polymerase-3 subunit epsilon
MLDFLRSLEQRRGQALKKAGHPVMQQYLSTPFPGRNQAWNDTSIVSLDFETTGLNPQQHHILSYGKVEIERGLIRLASAEHRLVRTEYDIPEESAIIHHITDDKASQGESFKQILPRMLEFLRGKVMLVHFSRIELGFLDAACRRLYQTPFLIPTIDTLVLAERVLRRRNHSLAPNQLRLFNLREAFGLPKYRAHDALNDAITTAELFLALESDITPGGDTQLKDLTLK